MSLLALMIVSIYLVQHKTRLKVPFLSAIYDITIRNLRLIVPDWSVLLYDGNVPCPWVMAFGLCRCRACVALEQVFDNFAHHLVRALQVRS